MSSKTPSADDIVRPMQSTQRWYYIVFGIASLLALGWFGLWSIQLQRGLAVTNLADWGSAGGVTWGL